IDRRQLQNLRERLQRADHANHERCGSEQQCKCNEKSATGECGHNLCADAVVHNETQSLLDFGGAQYTTRLKQLEHGESWQRIFPSSRRSLRWFIVCAIG